MRRHKIGGVKMNNEPVERTPEQEEIENLKRQIDRLEERVSALEGTTQNQQRQIRAQQTSIPRPLVRR